MSEPHRAPPVVVAATVRDEYAHVARQRCQCGATYLVTDEWVERPGGGAGVEPGRVHVLAARCLNSDCNRTALFHFSLTSELCAGGLGGALVGALNVTDPARTFRCIGVAPQIAVGLVSTWAAARAAGVAPESLAALVADATRHTGVSPDLAADVSSRLAAIGPQFDAIVAALQRECVEVPAVSAPPAAPAHPPGGAPPPA